MMKCLYAGIGALVLGCSVASGQTNGWDDVSPVLPVPHLELRTIDSTLDSTGGQQPATSFDFLAGTPAPSSQLSTSLGTASVSDRRDFEQELFRRMDRAGYFDRPERPADSPVLRWAEGTLRPEEVRVGKTKMSCSLYTAFKRKNPLCLLNAQFLHISW